MARGVIFEGSRPYFLDELHAVFQTGATVIEHQRDRQSRIMVFPGDTDIAGLGGETRKPRVEVALVQRSDIFHLQIVDGWNADVVKHGRSPSSCGTAPTGSGCW